MKMRVSILAAVAPSLVAGGVLPRTANPKGALYFLDNDPSGASVISLQIAQDGSLSNPVRTLTGGKGLYGSSATGPLAAGKFDAINMPLVSVDPRTFTLFTYTFFYMYKIHFCPKTASWSRTRAS